MTCCLGIEFGDEFYEIEEVTHKKEEFVKTLLPAIVAENSAILKERQFIIDYFSHDFFITYEHRIGSKNHQKLAKIAKKYNIDSLYDVDEYLKKIDTIPLSLAISQAALESGWGSSEYTKKYNNLYGHYTFYTKGNSHAIAGKRERIRIFSTLRESIQTYMHNLNTHWAYAGFRKAREEARKGNEHFGGLSALKHLSRYSEIGEKYGKLLRSVIRANNLNYLDSLDSRIALSFLVKP